jgi:uncharacterized protein YutE (UPF0331/DUF86 family)
MIVKHNQAQCLQAMIAIKDLVQQIKRIDDEDVKKHVCDSALDLCNQLLRDGKEV